MTTVDTPAWVQDAVFYQIFPDRFARSGRSAAGLHLEPWDSPPTTHGFKGGDLWGVLDRLDYLQDLGVTALYLNPIFQSAANHRYHTYDYFQVDPILGGNEALRALLDEAHRRGMRIVLDGVFNHTGRGFFQFHHILENGHQSPYRDWFIIHHTPLRPYNAPPGEQGYEAWWNLPALPKLNTATPAVRQFLWQVATHWIEFGIDGWRLDVPAEIDDDEFWREFRRRVKAANPEAYIVGEIWHDAHRWLQGDQFDAVMNYGLARVSLGFFVGEALWQEEVARCGYHHIDPLDGQAFAAEVDRLRGLYPWPVVRSQLNLLGSHDTPRFKTLARSDGAAYRLATLFQMTYPGAPCIYYGDEIGLEGRHDPDCRRAFPWEAGRWDRDLHAFVRRCIALRRAHPALRRGDWAWLHVGDDLVAYRRALGEEQLIVVLNRGQGTAQVVLPLAEGAVLRDAWSGQTVAVAQGQGAAVAVAARSGVVFRVGDS